MRYIFKAIRWVLGRIILVLDWFTRPRPLKRPAEQQAMLDAQTSKYALYQFYACPFCVKTRRSIRRLGLNIETRDARNNLVWQKQLISEGGKYQVPCLRIEQGNDVQWLYESTEINQFLENSVVQHS